MNDHADTIRSFFMDRYGTDSYNVDQRTLAAIPGSHRRNPPKPNTSAGRALAALDALLDENQRLCDMVDIAEAVSLTNARLVDEGRAENQRLREALQTITATVDRASTPDRAASDVMVAIRAWAREALAGDAE